MAKRKKQTKLQRQIKAQERRIQKIIKEIEEAGFDVKYKLPKLGQRPSTTYLKRLKGVKKVAVSNASFAPTGESYRQWVINISNLKRDQTRKQKKEDNDKGYTPTPRPKDYTYTEQYDGEEADEDERLDNLYQQNYDTLIGELNAAILSEIGSTQLAARILRAIDIEISAKGFNDTMERITNNWETVWYYLQAAIWYVDPDTGEIRDFKELLSYYNELMRLLLK